VFQPCKGNVAFGSASDSWAFRLDQFADMYSAKLGAKPAALVQVGGEGGPLLLLLLLLLRMVVLLLLVVDHHNG
jgi:hypothetical protein